MIGRYSVTLNGEPLSQISPQIIITDVKYDPPSLNIETYQVAKRHGSLIHRQYVEKKSVAITFMIREYNTERRQAVCASIIKWAKKGGVLKISDRPGQHLDCVCESYPSVASVRDWLSEVSITFSAFANPFWIDDAPSSISLSWTSKSGMLYVPGDAMETFVEATVKAKAALTSFSLTVAGRTMTITSSIAKNHTVKLTYDKNMILSIKDNNTSILNKRTGVDDLIAVCGERNAVSFTSSANADVVFSAKGAWL